MVERVGTCNPVAIDVTRVWVPIFWSASRGGRNARLSTALLRNDSYAFDAENERLVVVSAAHGRVHVLGPPAEVRDVLASQGVTGPRFGTVYALRVPLKMLRVQSPASGPVMKGFIPLEITIDTQA